MLARTWTTKVDDRRTQEYESFARDVSLPMFRASSGCVGVLMSRRGNVCEVLTLWRDARDIAALGHSPSYRDTVERIRATGFLLETNDTTVASVHLAWLGEVPVDADV